MNNKFEKAVTDGMVVNFCFEQPALAAQVIFDLQARIKALQKTIDHAIGERWWENKE